MSVTYQPKVWRVTRTDRGFRCVRIGTRGPAGPAGPNEITTATATTFASQRGFVSDGDSVIPLTFGGGLELVGGIPLTQYVVSVQIATAGCSLDGLLVGQGGAVTAIDLPGGGTTFLRDDGTFATPPGGMSVGGTVTGGTSGRVLYVGPGPVLAEDAGTADLVVGPRTVVGTLKVRQSGGVAGTDEGEVRHDGSRYIVASKDGPVRLVVPTSIGSGTAIEVYRQDGTVNSGFDVSAVGAVTCQNLVCPDISGVQVQTLGLRFASTKGLLWYSSNWTDTLQTGIHQAAARVIEVNNGTRSGAGGTVRSVPLTPSQITSDQNNYAPGVAMHYRLSSDASRTLTGLSVGQVDGQTAEFWNVGSNNIVLAHDSASSSAANQFLNSGGADITLASGEMAFLRWFSAEQSNQGGWRVVKG